MKMSVSKIAIIGLGYVGLPLARLFAEKYSVVGYDIKNQRVAELKSDDDVTLEVDNNLLKPVLVANYLEKKGLFITSRSEDIVYCNGVNIRR